ncbi:MAG TPA: Gmad2 immunoglobulin-like domain-containing protein [Solirubrobacteraceae bacterium]|nr:Gmad2 immunoglobulin-like domain-containing protein [Solirubrobacteraceae bacterium]
MRLAAAIWITALALAAGGCGERAADGAPAPDAPDVLWPDPNGSVVADDPIEAARSFVETYIGLDAPALSGFRSTGGGSGQIDAFRRGEDGRPLAAVAATISLVRREDRWFVTQAGSPEVEIERPAAGATVAPPLPIAGRGRGFEGTVVLEVRAAFATEPLAREPVVAGAAGALEPFEAALAFDPGDAAAGAVVALTGSGIAAADGFAAFPVRFRR